MSVLDALKGTHIERRLANQHLLGFYAFLGCAYLQANFPQSYTYSNKTSFHPGVLKLALIHDGLARGLREASKALDRRQAHMCVLNEGCEEEAYKKLVVALCSEHKIPLIKVPDGKQLGEWAGLCVLDREGNARKVVNCSCVVVRDWGEESQERSVLLNYFQTEQ
jgi:small subunit ribosomal protein S12e